MPTQTAKKTHFGFTALFLGVISILLLGIRFAVAYMRISPELFGRMNQFTTLFFCILTPLAFALGVWGHTRKNDSKAHARIAIGLTTLPFLVLFVQFALSFFVR